MALKGHSLFYYGHKVDETNNKINFTDITLGPELVAEIPVGSYTLTKFLQVVANALNVISANDWTVTVDRTTRLVTLTSSVASDLLFLTGSNALNSPFSLLGFTQSDFLNQTSFVATLPSGQSYSPQFPLQSYKSKEQNKKLVNAVVSKSATGDSVSVQSFGVDRFIKLNIKYATNNPTEGLLRNNPNAVEELEAFMDYVIEKAPIEFIENELDPDTFDKVYLESAPGSQDGTGYELIEFFDRGLPEFFETGVLTFKLINVE